MIRVLLVDDEPLARQLLADLIEEMPDVELVGEAGNGRKAVKLIRSLKPDLVFLDVQMPGLTGPEVVREIGPDAMPVTIFVTAYDQYALKAFELSALDYLLKPFDDERFEQAIARARKIIELQEVGAMTERLRTLLESESEAQRPESGDPAPTPRYLERIAVDLRGRMRIIAVDDLEYITASGPYAELHVGEQTFLIREQMRTLEEGLDPGEFFRIHRSAIVRLDRIETLLNGAGGDYAVRLKDGTELSVSRSRREALMQRLGIQLNPT